MKNALIYDIEIRKAVPDRRNPNQEGVEYCAGWEDHKNMGVSVVGVYDYNTDRYRVFMEDNIHELAELVRDRSTLVSFNGVGFDNKVLEHHMNPMLLELSKCYDILREMWVAAGLAPEFDYRTHGGYRLDDTAYVNLGISKSGDGGNAPVLWQQKEIGTLVDYCLEDVRITKRLFDRVKGIGGLRSPKDPSRFLEMRKP